MPAPAVVMLAMVGLCDAEEKALGPDQLQLVAPVAPPVKVSVAPTQIGFGPADAVTTVGTVVSVIATHFAALVPQVLLAVTHTLPLLVPKVTVIPVVVCPDVIVAPAGTVHV